MGSGSEIIYRGCIRNETGLERNKDRSMAIRQRRPVQIEIHRRSRVLIWTKHSSSPRRQYTNTRTASSARFEVWSLLILSGLLFFVGRARANGAKTAICASLRATTQFQLELRLESKRVIYGLSGEAGSLFEGEEEEEKSRGDR